MPWAESIGAYSLTPNAYEWQLKGRSDGVNAQDILQI